MLNIFSAIALTMLSMGCNSNQSGQNSDSKTEKSTSAVTFDADKAYNFVKAQCDFGPRVPETPAHEQCGAYLEQQLKQSCDKVIAQKAVLSTFDGKNLNATNYIGIINPEASTRILLVAHWDCRPWADEDLDESKRRQPVMGANDGASGVGVLLELARLMKEKKPGIGVDFLLVDAEDWGKTDDQEGTTWALGTQYWVNNPHEANYKPMYGILLDMVGAKGATFRHEAYSHEVAGSLVESLWATAADAGFEKYFLREMGGAVTDDHVAINKMGIPCIDVIDLRQSPTGFFKEWHTTHDTMENIDKNTLKAVGQTLADFIYSIE